ncbi:MAG: 50S ribosomal protein L10 [Candidatus Diapherotrites archaeon]
MKRHKKAWKETELHKVEHLLSHHPVIAIASLEGFPAALFAQTRKKLHGKAEIHVSKVRVIERAFKTSKLKDSGLLEHVKGNIAVIATSMNPFELFQFLKKNKGRIAAKPGSIALDDISISAMDTGLPPGPALSDLKAAGLNARIQGSTIAIMEDKIVAKKGETISKPVASVLTKLDIKPVKVGLNILAIYEEGQLYTADSLDVDEDQILADIQRIFREGIALAIAIEDFNGTSTPFIVERAAREAMALQKAVEAASPSEAKTETPVEAKAEESAEAKVEKPAEENKEVSQ